MDALDRGSEARPPRRSAGAPPVAGERLAAAAVGVFAGLGLSRALPSLIPDLGPVYAYTVVAVAALLGVVALFACYLPARAAGRVDPLEAIAGGD